MYSLYNMPFMPHAYFGGSSPKKHWFVQVLPKLLPSLFSMAVCFLLWCIILSRLNQLVLSLIVFLFVLNVCLFCCLVHQSVVVLFVLNVCLFPCVVHHIKQFKLAGCKLGCFLICLECLSVFPCGASCLTSLNQLFLFFDD